ncbi:transcriptional repressor LexA [Streptacidiphilus monticola]
MTERQEAVLAAVASFVRAHGYPPSMRDIGAAVGLTSTSSVSHQVNRLERLGFLAKDPNRPRSYALVAQEPAASPAGDRDPGPAVTAPLLGQIAAGAPITAEQDVEDVFTLPPQLVGAHDPEELFVLKVRGDSMAGPGRILDGDLVVVRHQQAADEGDVIAALLEDEATVKRLKRKDGRVWLMPDNPAYDPIPGDHATVLGRVVAVMRGL